MRSSADALKLRKEELVLSLKAQLSSYPLSNNWTKQLNYLGVVFQIMAFWDKLDVWEQCLVLLPVNFEFCFLKMLVRGHQQAQ